MIPLFVAAFLFSGSIPVEYSVPMEKSITANKAAAIPDLTFEDKVNALYKTFASTHANMPSLVSFYNGMLGYSKLLDTGKIQNQILTIVDFSLPSTVKRMWVLDLKAKKVLFNTFVAHGQGTGGNMATDFSNVANSHKSSLGFYLTAETYYGKHGLSMRMDGLEKGFNSNARERYIVVHGADYATSSFIERIGRLGRSWGCPAVPSKFAKDIIDTIKEKSCFFVYYPSEKYLETSSYLNWEPTYANGNFSQSR